jgi:hypothetical protein
MQGRRKKRIAESSDQIAGSKEKRNDNAETQGVRREENPRRRRKAAPTLKNEESAERRKMFVIGLII